MSAPELFTTLYAETHRTADLVDGGLPQGETLSAQELNQIVSSLQGALCAARELCERKHGHPPARIGD